jgi:hypothetical protein
MFSTDLLLAIPPKSIYSKEMYLQPANMAQAKLFVRRSTYKNYNKTLSFAKQFVL